MKTSFFLVSFAALLGATICSAQGINFDFSNIANEQLQITGTGGQISFATDVDGVGFSITSSAQPGLQGLFGAVDGSFTIGAITNFGGGLEQAPVTGTATFKIYDPSSTTVALTADVKWGDFLSFGPLGQLNSNTTLNMGNFHYTGTYAPLIALGNSTDGTTVVSFQILPVQSIEQLTTPGALFTSSFSGSTSVIPEPTDCAAMMGGMALLGVTLLRRRLVKPTVAAVRQR